MLTDPLPPADRSAVPGYLDFDVVVSGGDGATVVQITGDLDCYTAPRLRAALLEVAATGSKQVVLDQMPIVPLAQFQFQSISSPRVSGLIVSGLGTFDATKVKVGSGR